MSNGVDKYNKYFCRTTQNKGGWADHKPFRSSNLVYSLPTLFLFFLKFSAILTVPSLLPLLYLSHYLSPFSFCYNSPDISLFSSSSLQKETFLSRTFLISSLHHSFPFLLIPYLILLVPHISSLTSKIAFLNLLHYSSTSSNTSHTTVLLQYISIL